MSPEQQKVAIKEFNLRKGVGVAVLSGVMSACFAYGLAAGDPIKALTLQHGTAELWQGLPVLVVVLLGGFLTNFVWCVILLARNGLVINISLLNLQKSIASQKPSSKPRLTRRQWKQSNTPGLELRLRSDG